MAMTLAELKAAQAEKLAAKKESAVQSANTLGVQASTAAQQKTALAAEKAKVVQAAPVANAADAAKIDHSVAPRVPAPPKSVLAGKVSVSAAEYDNMVRTIGTLTARVEHYEAKYGRDTEGVAQPGGKVFTSGQVRMAGHMPANTDDMPTVDQLNARGQV